MQTTDQHLEHLFTFNHILEHFKITLTFQL